MFTLLYGIWNLNKRKIHNIAHYMSRQGLVVKGKTIMSCCCFSLPRDGTSVEAHVQLRQGVELLS